MKLLSFFVGIFFLLIPVNLFSANEYSLYFTQISTNEGLSQNTVRTILEDKKGFIWAGTLDGLNRYDGYHIIPYKPQLGSANTLIDHRVKDVFQDRDGYLWIKTYKNEFSCYDPVSDSFIDYISGNIARDNVEYINYCETSNGDIWLWGSKAGCLQIKKQDGKFIVTPFLIEETTDNRNTGKFLFEDSKSTIWVGGSKGLYKIQDGQVEYLFENKYVFTKAVEVENKLFFITDNSIIIEFDLKRKTFNEINTQNHISNIVKLTDNELLIVSDNSDIKIFNINSKIFEKPEWANDPKLKINNIQFIQDKNGGVWIYNHSGIMWYFNQDTRKVKKLELIPPDVVSIIDLERYIVFIDSQDLIWITTYGNGLFCYNTKTDVLSNYKYNANRNSLASDYLLAITEDRYGTIWIGSEYAGIIKVIKSNYDIRIVRPEKEASIGKNNNVRTIYSDAFDNIWVGTKNGSLYLFDNKLLSEKCIYKDINSYVLAEDANKRIWVGTKGKGLYIINENTLKEEAHYTPENTTLSHNTIFSILKDTKNRIWVGTFGGGINLVDKTSDNIEFKQFFNNEGNRSYIRYLYQDSQGSIWVASSDGVICFDPDKLITDPKAYISYRMNLNDSKSLNCNDIKTIFEDEEGVIWIGTAGGGINKFIPPQKGEKGFFVSYTRNDGLAGDFVSGIMEDKDNNLWISTESGITKFNKKNNSFIVYNFSEKTYGNHFNENANLYCHDGNMLWGSLDGLLVLNPQNFLPNPNTPPVTFTNFSIYNQIVRAGEKESPLKQSISYSDKIELNYKQNTFTIEFASLDMKDPTKNKYVYMLENYDKQWSSVSQLNMATYKNIPSGKYIFKVRGTNSDGVWNEDVTQLKIVVTPPFWRAWYAYILYGILILVALYLVLRIVYKFNALSNNIKVEKELTNYKLRFFTNISHEFRTPLTLIRGAVENLISLTDTSERVKKQISVLSRNSLILTRLIDQLLEFRKLQNNVLTLNLEETDIIEFSREIYNSFQEIAEQKKIEYIFTNNTDANKMYIDRRKVDKILYNLLSNAFRFTPKNGKIELSISFDTKRQTCVIKVKDNGIGIPKDKQHLLFSRFMQINFSSTGTGVGLSLVKEFVDVHKGKIWYEDNQNQGSVFSLELSTDKSIYEGENFVTPSCPDIITTETSQKEIYPSNFVENIKLPEIDDSTLSNYKMLVIDDNDDIRNFLIDEFSKYFMVDTAEDGKSGMQKAIDNNPDLIICDVMMPEMDGFELTRRLKEDFQTCHIPIVLLTAHSSIEHQLEGIQSGADAYIMKPFSLKYLVTRVFKLIEQRELLKKRFSNEYVLDGNLIMPTDKDKEFFDLIDKILEAHLADYQFSVDKFAELAKQRRTIFYKKVKGITGLSPNELIKLKRMKKAAELLLQGELTVSEVSYKVGFEDPFYFSKCFKAHYKCSPSKYGQTIREKNNAP